MLLRCALFVVRELILLLLRSLWFTYMKWHTCCWAHPPISIQLCQRSLRTDKNGKNLLNVKPGDCLISTQTSHGCRETNRHRVAVEVRVYRATGRCWMACLPSRGFASLLPACPLVDGVSTFPRPCPPCLPVCLPACLPCLSPSLSPLLVSLCWMVCPPSRGLLSLVSQLISQLVSQLVFTEKCAYFHRTPGLRMMLSFTFFLRCFQHIHFDSPMLLDSSVWNQILAPPSDVSFIVFRHLALRQSERNGKNKREVVSGTYCRHFHDSCRCYFMCLSLFLKTWARQLFGVYRGVNSCLFDQCDQCLL